MPNTLRIKRRGSGSAGAPSTLENAELAFNEVDNTLYYGEGTGGAGGSASTVLAIAGDGAFVNKTGTQTISGDKTFTGGFDISSASVSGFTVTQNLVITGNLTVNGTTTTVNSSEMSVDDKNIVLGATSSPTDAAASGGGITKRVRNIIESVNPALNVLLFTLWLILSTILLPEYSSLIIWKPIKPIINGRKKFKIPGKEVEKLRLKKLLKKTSKILIKIRLEPIYK